MTALFCVALFGLLAFIALGFWGRLFAPAPAPLPRAVREGYYGMGTLALKGGARGELTLPYEHTGADDIPVPRGPLAVLNLIIPSWVTEDLLVGPITTEPRGKTWAREMPGDVFTEVALGTIGPWAFIRPGETLVVRLLNMGTETVEVQAVVRGRVSLSLPASARARRSWEHWDKAELQRELQPWED